MAHVKKSFSFLLTIIGFLAVSASNNDLVLSKSKGPIEGRGIVHPISRCGGVGTLVQLRISQCEGECVFVPGTVYLCEMDFYPAAPAPLLSLRVQICTATYCQEILDVELQGSSVQPGNLYTARYSIVPNDILSGQPISFLARISHTDSGLEETCIRANAVIA